MPELLFVPSCCLPANRCLAVFWKRQRSGTPNFQMQLFIKVKIQTTVIFSFVVCQLALVQSCLGFVSLFFPDLDGWIRCGFSSFLLLHWGPSESLYFSSVHMWITNLQYDFVTFLDFDYLNQDRGGARSENVAGKKLLDFVSISSTLHEINR